MCDDGNTSFNDGCLPFSCAVEGGGWTCAGQPSVCQNCGNGRAEGTEVCDGQDVRGAGCLALGMRQGGPPPNCQSQCTQVFFQSGNCGPLIQTANDLEQAFQDAENLPQDQIIAIPAGRYILNSGITVDSFSSGTVFVQPLSGPVTLVSSTPQVLFDVRASRAVFRDLTIEDAEEAFRLENNTAQEPGVTLERLWFTNPTVRVDRLIVLQGGRHRVVGNRFETTQTSNLGTGEVIVVQSGNADVVAQNVISGPFSVGIFLQNVQTNPVFLDHNSIRLTDSPGVQAVALRMQDGNACVRNNVLAYDGPSFNGYALQAQGGGFMPSMMECGNATPVGFNNAYVSQGGSLCSGGCGQWCPGPLCDLNLDPQYAGGDAALCLGAGSLLRDAALPLGYDLVDNDPALFRGVAPDVGARESQSGRAYGQFYSACP